MDHVSNRFAASVVPGVGSSLLATPSKSGRSTSDYVGLSRQIQDAGLMRRRYGYYWTKLCGAVALFASTVVVFVWIGNSWWQMFTAAAFAPILTQTAFLGHDAAHRQIFKSGKWNEWVSMVLADLMVGISYGWWQHKHTRHHGNPNKEGADPDIDFPPLALTPVQARSRRTELTRWLTLHQGWLFFPMLPLEGFALHMSGIRRLASREPIARRWVELSFMTARLGGYLALVFLVLSPDKALVFLAIQIGLFGMYMGASFAPNHKGMPIVPKDARLDFLRRQVLMSRNIRGSVMLDVAMGGLNYQIEHHLFPSMPRPHLRRAQPIIEAYCSEHDVLYTSTTLMHSYGIVVTYLNRVGMGARDPFECPLVAERSAPR
jgi:fatty acid desaturase